MAAASETPCETPMDSRRQMGRRGGRGSGATTSAPGERTLQGMSVATWEYGLGRGPRAGEPVPPGQLKVVTTGMRAGYLRRNGVPYSENAVITEFFNMLPEPDGGKFLVVTTMVQDPTYLNTKFVVSSHFKKEADGSKWDPQPCIVKW